MSDLKKIIFSIFDETFVIKKDKNKYLINKIISLKEKIFLIKDELNYYEFIDIINFYCINTDNYFLKVMNENSEQDFNLISILFYIIYYHSRKLGKHIITETNTVYFEYYFAEENFLFLLKYVYVNFNKKINCEISAFILNIIDLELLIYIINKYNLTTPNIYFISVKQKEKSLFLENNTYNYTKEL